ncbi:hypothetical protein PsYK624_161510 [Phanerochaete sordida]|uniref:F-box domain-containing protein n=1 Tax=Phanerochaete sordida TaxID=48140 RepID=A0A9P3GQY1_9APHY|nr:hypothetical protein PsYK624_161510 [Phanerochaete sordida]
MLNLPDLPNELLHQIAEHLHPLDWHVSEEHSARHDLRSFSLVCQRSRAVGQAHLFRDVVFPFRCAADDERWLAEDGSTLLEWNPQWQNRPRTPWRTLSMFRTFLREHASLGQEIRRLKLVAFPRDVAPLPNDGSEYVEDSMGDDSSTETFVLHQLLALTPHLDELELTDVLLISTPEYWKALQGPLPSLKFLDIDFHKRTDSQGHVGDILGSFNTLARVRARRLPKLHEWPDDSAPPNMHITSLTCLSESDAAEVLLDYVFDSPSVETLRELYTGYKVSVSPVYDELLARVGPQLHGLGVTVSEPAVLRADYGPARDVSACAQLRRLVLRCTMYHAMVPMTTAEWERLIGVLSSCQACAHLAVVDFVIWHPIESIAWLQSLTSTAKRRMEDVLLLLAEKTSLRKVHFVLSCFRPLPVTFQAILRGALPRLSKKKLLEISYSDNIDIPA